jgi:hypothetical protein
MHLQYTTTAINYSASLIMSLNSLPAETILQIAKLLAKTSLKSLNALIRSSRRYFELLTTKLYDSAFCAVKVSGKRLGRNRLHHYTYYRSRRLPVYYISPPRFWECAVHWRSDLIRAWFSNKPLEWVSETKFVQVLNREVPVESLIHKFIRAGNFELAMMVLEKGVDVNSRTSLERTPLHVATERDSLEMIRHLLDNDADP